MSTTTTESTKGSATTTTATMTITLRIQFAGGLETLFDGKRDHTVNMPTIVDKTEATVTHLIRYLCENMSISRPELFVEDDTVYVQSFFLFFF